MRCNAESFNLYPKAYLCLVYILELFDFNIMELVTGNRNCTISKLYKRFCVDCLYCNVTKLL